MNDDLAADTLCCVAARLMLRWRDQTTSPRQRTTAIAKKPRIAPTIMKTVPSGSVDCFMKGALAVGGTVAATNTPEIRGTSVLIVELPLVAPVIATVEVKLVVAGCVDDVEGALLEVVGSGLDEEEELDEELVGASEEVVDGGCEVVVGCVCEVVVGSEVVVCCVVFCCEVFSVGCEEDDCVASELVGVFLVVPESFDEVSGSAAETGTASRPTPAARERRGKGRENLMARVS